MKKISDRQQVINIKHQGVVALYESGKYTTEQIAKNYSLSAKQVQRIAKKYGVIRTQAESNKLIAPLKNYHSVPVEHRVKRKQLTNRTRYDLINLQPFCGLCGLKPIDGIRLEVDHIDNNPENNTNDNLQVLCNLCNRGKFHSSRNYR